jgi:hypothetical protein
MSKATSIPSAESRKKFSNGQRAVGAVVLLAVVAVIVTLVIHAIVDHHRVMSTNEDARAQMVDIRAEQVATLSGNQITIIREDGYGWDADIGGKTGTVRVTVKLGYCNTVSGFLLSSVRPEKAEEVGPLNLEVPSLASRWYVSKPGSSTEVSVAQIPVTSKTLPGLYDILQRSALAQCGFKPIKES